MMDKIYAITHRGIQEEIIIVPTENENEVRKTYYDRDGKRKRVKVYNVTDVALINRRARNVQDYFLNMVENYGYQVHYE